MTVTDSGRKAQQVAQQARIQSTRLGMLLTHMTIQDAIAEIKLMRLIDNS